MHPRSTRNRPLLVLPKSYRLFSNNISSPGFLRPSFFRTLSAAKDGNPIIFVNAVSCKVKSKKEETWHGIKLRRFNVEFWSSLSDNPKPIISIMVDTPSHWNTMMFLKMFERDLGNHSVISLLNGYYIDGNAFHLNTINTLHHYFKN
jgi:hypothetical protein